MPSFIGLPQRLQLEAEEWKINEWQLLCGLRVAMPGIIKSFDPAKQTVSVQLAIRENININLASKPTDIPILEDVPIVIPRAGGFLLTLPVQAGDECLVIFADMCIDGWWQNGGVQNQMDRRRHDLSDGFAILGCWSQPNVVPSYSTVAAELRDEPGAVKISVQNGQVNVTAPMVNITGSTQVNVSGGHTVIDGKNFLAHQHTDPQGGVSGPVI